jgi:hypothetical protein
VAPPEATLYCTRVLSTILALALSSGAPPAAADETAPDETLADDEPVYAEPSAPRLRVAGWGGTLYDTNARQGIPFGGGEVSWAFDRLDLGVLAQAYRFGIPRATSEWSPVVLARLEQRFETQRGLEASLGFGIGAGRERSWTAWFQFAAGFRVTAGPVFVGGEFGFEQDRFFRLGATAGLAVF